MSDYWGQVDLYIGGTEHALLGSEDLAIETIPRKWDLELNSALILYPGPPIPQEPLLFVFV